MSETSVQAVRLRHGSEENRCRSCGVRGNNKGQDKIHNAQGDLLGLHHARRVRRKSRQKTFSVHLVFANHKGFEVRKPLKARLKYMGLGVRSLLPSPGEPQTRVPGPDALEPESQAATSSLILHPSKFRYDGLALEQSATPPDRLFTSPPPSESGSSGVLTRSSR